MPSTFRAHLVSTLSRAIRESGLGGLQQGCMQPPPPTHSLTYPPSPRDVLEGRRRRGGGGGRSGTQKFVYQKWLKKIFSVVTSIAYRQGTWKREGAQAVHQSVRHEITRRPPTPCKHPNGVRNT